MGYSASAQWVDGGVYQTTTDAISIGTATAPSGTLDVINSSGTSKLFIAAPYTDVPAVRYNIGVLNLTNSATGDKVYMGLRKSSDSSHEMLQSVYDATSGTWKEFTFFHFNTSKYEMREGIADAEFKNSGDFLINNSGSVGIGTSTIPSGYKLAVNGSIICEELMVELNTSWPDYVFKDNYNLKSLIEVEGFIKENGHLPGIPSAQEVEKNGISVGEMNQKLLEKIEELTLYMIDIKKENEELKSIVNQINMK